MEFFKKYAYVILGVFCVLALGGLYMATRRSPAGIMDLGPPIGATQPAVTEEPPEPQAPVEPAEPDITPTPEPDTIFVHIIGAVYNPGVYEVPRGARIYDVLRLAGGYTEEADPELINLSAFVQDAMQIRIPAIGDEPQEIVTPDQPGQAATDAPQGNQQAITADGRVNINLASLTELQTLPGIGSARSQAIITSRDTYGRFNSIEDIKRVPGIGEGIFGSIRNYITVD